MLELINDGPLDIAVGRSRKEINWKNREWSWRELVEKLSFTHRTAETLGEYNLSKKPRQDEIKDVGGFVGGYLQGGRRKNGSVSHRQLITLDLDFAPSDFWDELMLVESYGCLLYSTHKHCPSSPRLRLLIPLDRPVDPNEYEAISRRIAGDLGIEYFDPTTFEPSRLMYWPSTSSDGEYVFHYQDGPWVSADAVLGRYRDWKDISEWPISSKIGDIMRRSMQKQGDPLEKPGIIGAFCRVYSIAEAIDTYLPSIYEPCAGEQGEGMANRYTYLHGSTAAGVVVYEDKFAYSHHGTDPMSGKLCNAFDMVRLHLFGLKDDGIPVDTSVVKLPSYEAMCELATIDRAVRIQIGVEKIAEAEKEFGGKIKGADAEGIGGQIADGLKRVGGSVVGPDGLLNLGGSVEDGLDDMDENWIDPEDELNDLVQTPTELTDADMEWLAELDVDKKGNYHPTIDNIMLILANDPKLKGKLVYSSFDKREIAVGHLPWRRVTRSTKNLTDRDESGMRHYLEKVYGIVGTAKILDGWSLAIAKNTVHPVKEYLGRLVWDGVPRVEELFIRYLGADDNVYVRAVTRKSLVAAVARIYRPGIKFDNVLTFVGAQGIGKSELINRLGGDWYSDSFGGIGTKEAFESIQGVWLVEIAELAGLRRAEVDSIKHFISKQADYYRVPYGKRIENFPRQCVFFATTNDDDFLKDQTGNRRWWVVKTMVPESCVEVEVVSRVWNEVLGIYDEVETLELRPKGNLFKEMDRELVGQIWAEAISMWKKGEKLFIDSETEREAAILAEQSQIEHTEVDPRWAILEEFLELPLCDGYYELGIYERRAWIEEMRRGLVRLTSDDVPTEMGPDGEGFWWIGSEKVTRRDRVTIHDLWVEGLCCDLKNMTAANTKTIHTFMRTKKMQKQGWESPKSGKIKVGGVPIRGYVRG
jgi:putative DNA primase/helicase